MSNFPDYAGPLIETILLGNLAVWKRGRVEWDPKNLKPQRPGARKDRPLRIPRRIPGLTLATDGLFPLYRPLASLAV